MNEDMKQKPEPETKEKQVLSTEKTGDVSGGLSIEENLVYCREPWRYEPVENPDTRIIKI